MKKILGLTISLMVFIFAAGIISAEPHAFPVPWVGTRDTVIHFTNLPNEGEIKIYTILGEEVASIKFDSGVLTKDWPVTTNGGQKVSTGVYLYVVEGGGQLTKGKLVVIR